MAHHSRITKISKFLRKFRNDQASRKMRWQKLHDDEAPTDYISRRGLLLCYFSQDYPKNQPKRLSTEKLEQFNKLQAAIGLIPSMKIAPALPGKKAKVSSRKQHKIKQKALRIWKNFDLNAHMVLKPLLKKKNFSTIDLEDFSFSPSSLNPQKPDPCLGVYIEQLVKFLYSKNLPRRIRDAGKDLLELLQKKLFESTQLTANEKSLFLETYQLLWVKRPNPYLFKQRKARKSAHPIDEAHAADVIEWLIEEILCTASLGAALTLLYIWFALQAAFAGVTTSVKEILRLSASPSTSRNLQKLPIIKGGKIPFGKKELPIPNGLLKIIDAAIDSRSQKPIFQHVRSTIENYLQKANEALGFDNKDDPLTLETFLRRPIP